MAASPASCLRVLSLAAWATLFALHHARGQAEPNPRLAPEHELLKQDVGTWDTQIHVWPGPGAEPIASTGRETSRLLPGGLWLETRFEGTMAGVPCVGVGTWGYDPVEKQYVGTWVDSLTPHITHIRGTYYPATKTMTHTTTGRDPASGATYQRNSILRYLEDGSRLVEAEATGPDGQKWKMMEVKYTLRER